MTVGRLFGTDGIRGRVPQELGPELVLRVGWVAAGRLADRAATRRVVVGRDPRRSGDMLQAALQAGICAAGVDAVDAGIVPTPGLAWLTRAVGAAAGVVISASHNPAEYNGVKIFSADGYKPPDAEEDAIEAGVRAGDLPHEDRDGDGIGRIIQDASLVERYLDFLVDRAEGRAEGVHVVLDCANGAVFALAPMLFETLGATVTVRNGEPDGLNINADCGAAHPRSLADAVRAAGADLGFAFDGDGDRCIAVDERGNVVDGDVILALTALDRHHRGVLQGRGVVGTVMSNLGLERLLRNEGIPFYRTRVGDRYVLEEMRNRGLTLGGEQSGHLIFLDQDQTTGDGLLTAVQVMNILFREGRPLSELASRFERVPQRVINVAAADPQAVLEDPRVRRKIHEETERLREKGRILVRASGTEPVLRIMAEAPDEQTLAATLAGLEEVVREAAVGR